PLRLSAAHGRAGPERAVLERAGVSVAGGIGGARAGTFVEAPVPEQPGFRAGQTGEHMTANLGGGAGHRPEADFVKLAGEARGGVVAARADFDGGTLWLGVEGGVGGAVERAVDIDANLRAVKDAGDVIPHIGLQPGRADGGGFGGAIDARGEANSVV